MKSEKGIHGKALFCSTLPPARAGGAAKGFDSLGWSLALSDPVAQLRADVLDQVPALIDRAEAMAVSGLYVALALSYEAAPALDAALAAHAPAGPLAWALAFEQAASPTDACFKGTGGYSLGEWKALVHKDEYVRSIDGIRANIRLGECYQINYTIPFTASFSGNGWSLFHALAKRQGAGFCACLDLEEAMFLSFSPELFVLRQGRRLMARPMKGTSPRGRSTEEDDSLAANLADSTKDRAENVMIVDLMRNDLGRVAEAGSVEPLDMYRVERYPTMLQMTSTVRAVAREGVSLRELFKAVFPCGSVTGAPKVRAMQLIRDVEQGPRNVYCGAVGFLEPGGDCVFNVPIRTLWLDREAGRAMFHSGGGITHDSGAVAEYAECMTKMAFLKPALQHGSFRLLETMLLRRGSISLLEYHLDRMRDSARYFGFLFDEDAIRAALGRAVQQHPSGKYVLRLLSGRDGRIECQSRELEQSRKRAISVGWADSPVDSSDPMLFHKTDQREVYERARASQPGMDDTVLFNERGEATETCIATIVARIQGELVTPPLGSGLLPGTFRRDLLERGLARERVILRKELEKASFWCVNSVRGWTRARFSQE